MHPNVASAMSCEPALIDTIITNSPLCPGDHIDLSVVATGDILGYSWEGPGTGEFFSFTPSYSFNFQVLGEYRVVVYGECGNDTTMVIIDAVGAGAGHDDTLRICDDGPMQSLAIALGTHADGGTWTFDELPHSGIFDPAGDVSGDYVYTSPNAATCPGTSQTATITVDLTHVGPNMARDICSMDSAFDLLQLLAPNVTPGGAWSRYVFISLVPHNGIYDPGTDSSGTFQYAIQGCTASVIVNESPALPWFQDLDNDSLGDPFTMEWSCTQPQGYVADSTDNCTVFPGRIGSACDDGMPETVDDVLTDSCACAGSIPTFMTEEVSGKPAMRIWPNPNAGDRVFLETLEIGPATLDLVDALGRVILHKETKLLDGSPQIMDLPSGAEKGIYTLRLLVNDQVRTARLTIR